jgi:hypothetical protein
MSKKQSVALILVGFGMVLGFQNCGSHPSNSNGTIEGVNPTSGSFQMVGVVSKAAPGQKLVDGCSIQICGQDSLKNDICIVPVKFDTSKLNDGDTVSIHGTKRSDMVSICMAGEIVQVNSADVITPAN